MSAGQLTTNFISENMLHSKHWKFLALLAMYPWYSHETLDTMFTLIRSKNLKSYWITFAKFAIQNLFQETSHIHETLAPIWSPLRSLMDHPIPMPGAVNDALYIEVRTLINLWILYFNSNMHKCLFFFPTQATFFVLSGIYRSSMCCYRLKRRFKMRWLSSEQQRGTNTSLLY